MSEYIQEGGSERVKLVKLTYPIKIDGVDKDALSVRRPTVRDQMDYMTDKGDEADVKYIARLCRCSPKDLENMDYADWLGVQEEIQNFFPERFRAKRDET